MIGYLLYIFCMTLPGFISGAIAMYLHHRGTIKEHKVLLDENKVLHQELLFLTNTHDFACDGCCAVREHQIHARAVRAYEASQSKGETP